MKTLELHYPMIQFLINLRYTSFFNTRVNNAWPGILKFEAWFKRRILHAPNRIAKLNACKMRLLNQVNAANFNIDLFTDTVAILNKLVVNINMGCWRGKPKEACVCYSV